MIDQTIDCYILFFICVIGVCLGSFYNVVILRSLSNESIVFPSSKCPKCNHRLYPWHNIPILSYIFLRGKCHFCKEKISIQYPIVELITMILFGFSYIKFGFTWQLLFSLIIVSLLTIMTTTDIKEQAVDCNLAIGLGISGLIYNSVTGSFVNSILGLIAGILILEVVARLGYLFSKSRAMGEADTYVAAALGACFGFSGLLYILVYSLIASLLFIVPIFIYNQYRNDNKSCCILFILFTLAILVHTTLLQNYLTTALVILLGITLATGILKNIKQEQTLTYLPFVPAFAIGALYFLFI